MESKTEILITILGPTATGKTMLAAHLADKMGGEIISADSRQIYRNMDIGTGKDLADYTVNGKQIPYHLINIADAGEEYNLFRFAADFKKAFMEITERNNVPILCGGTGLYIESVLKAYNFSEVPEMTNLRQSLSAKTEDELTEILSALKPLHNTTDTVNRERLLRAIEIENYSKEFPERVLNMPEFDSFVFGMNYKRATVMERITLRLKERLENGMIEEVKALVDSGVKVSRLKSYGLEYKFITEYLLKEISYDEMFRLLNIAIHQFSKRQMTWFRRMERKGIKINWIDGDLSLEEKRDIVLEKVNGQ